MDFSWPPSHGVEAPKKPTTAGFPPWSYQELEAFRARWQIGTTKRAAFELLCWTGLRIGDAVKIGPGHIDRRGVLVYSQSKVKKPAYIPWTAALPATVARKLSFPVGIRAKDSLRLEKSKSLDST